MIRRASAHVVRVHTIAKRTTVRHAAPQRRTAYRLVAQQTATRKAPPVRSGVAAVVSFARSKVGGPYVSGGTGPRGYDCSGLTRAAFRRIGVSLPHSAAQQGRRGRHVAKSQRRAGDLMYWREGHVAIYVGGGYMIDAGNHRVGIVKRHVWGNPEYRRL